MKLALQPGGRNLRAKRILLPNTFQCSDDLGRFLTSAQSLNRVRFATLAFSDTRPLFSGSYKSLFPQLLHFHIHTKPPGVGVRRSQLRALCASVANPMFSAACRLLALFSVLPSFVFNRLQPLFPKHPCGGGVRHRIRRRSQPTEPARAPGVPIPTESCQLTADSRLPSGAIRSPHSLGTVAGPHRSRAIASINADVLRREVAGPVARAGRAGVQVHHDGYMVR